MLDEAIKEIRSGVRGFNRNEIYALAINEGYNAVHAQQLSAALNEAVTSNWQAVSPLFDALEGLGNVDLISEITHW